MNFPPSWAGAGQETPLRIRFQLKVFSSLWLGLYNTAHDLSCFRLGHTMERCHTANGSGGGGGISWTEMSSKLQSPREAWSGKVWLFGRKSSARWRPADNCESTTSTCSSACTRGPWTSRPVRRISTSCSSWVGCSSSTLQDTDLFLPHLWDQCVRRYQKICPSPHRRGFMGLWPLGKIRWKGEREK